MNRRTRLFAGTVLVGMLVAVLGVGVVFAQERGEGGKRGEYGLRPGVVWHPGESIEAFAEALGVTAEEIRAAARQVALDRIGTAVEDGRIGEERADEIRQKIESGETPSRHRLGRGWAFARFGFGPEAIAAALGVTVEDITAARQQVASDRIDEAVEAGALSAERAQKIRAALALGVTAEEIRAAARQVALDRIGTAVEDGRIGEERADEIRQKIESGETPSRHRLGRGWAFARFGFGPEAIAAALGVTVEDITAARQQVASDRIDEAVEAGALSAERAQKIRAAFESGEKLERGRGVRGHHRCAGRA